MSIPHELIDLVDRFDRNKEDYKSSGYNETQIRREFIDPLFILMGWDVNNKNGYGEAYKDVIHEDSIKIGGEVKAPDYCFRIGGTRKFFLEAKKPFVNIKQDIGPAFQLRRYGWSAKLPVSILTDFEEFAVYDCRIKPQKNDKSSVARIMYFTYDQYVNNWEELNGIFSKDAVLKGSFDRFVESKKQKKGTMGVDDEFLLEIESWRDILARNLAVRNPNLTTRDLNFAVHRIIDRFIFLRICEDRGIENYGRLRGLLNGDRVYPRLCQFFTEADDRYNSGLFHFNTERGRDEVPDNLTLTLNIDDKIFKDIIRSTYYPDSPYEFSVLPADILGQIYEQFLGKVIRLTEGHQAKVEEKPEVRKAGGVYYTPTFIVDYIVKNTLGELVKDKTPQQVSKLKILDPACGSGSFLIGAYQFLLDWHRDWYFQNNPEKHQKEIYKVGLNDWRLTTKERKRILLNNIFGVDIDSQAVEVTKLSLLLKVLEGENEQSINKQLELFHERALPDLGNNIKCGNSLIGPDFYDQQEFLFLSEEEKYRINVFDWNKEFENIMSNGGFDAIIGNPPYIRTQVLKEFAPSEVKFYKHAYTSASRGSYDIYVIFVEKGLSLLNNKGHLGFILPHKFFITKYGSNLRVLISHSKSLKEIVHFGDIQIFDGVTTYTCLLFLNKEHHLSFSFTQVQHLDAWRKGAISKNVINQFTGDTPQGWTFSVGKCCDLLVKLNRYQTRLADVTTRIFQGIKTSADKIFVVDLIKKEDDLFLVKSPQDNKQYWVEKDLFYPLIKGGECRRYLIKDTTRLILFPYLNDVSSGIAKLISTREMKNQYPLTWKYLLVHKEYLENRENGEHKEKWYEYGRSQALNVISLPKIVTPDISLNASYAYDENGLNYFSGGVSGGYGILAKDDMNVFYLLGLLNSKVLDWYIRKTSTQMRGGYFSFESRFIKHLPIIKIGKNDESGLYRQTQIISLVKKIIQLYKSLSIKTNPQESENKKRMIEIIDHQIDKLVYELYGLTEEEINIVENQ